ncbi:MAG: HAMP domain-containing protein, partial [Thermoanaerobaculia bacterium]
MSFPRRYALAILAPPLFTAFPLAAIFTQHVTGLAASAFTRVLAGALIAYVIGIAIAALKIMGVAEEFDQDVEAKRDAGESASACIQTTVLAAASVWLGLGVVVALVSSAIVLPTFLGFQYFVEAALMMAAPAMAWAYWYGKNLVVEHASEVPLSYRGTVFSFGLKIALVFIGFFVVATGALVLVLSSRIARVAGAEAAQDATRFGFAIAGLTALIFAAATWFLARDLSGPMRELMALAQSLSEGRFDVEPRVFSDDEVGRVASSFGVTR